MTDRTTPTFDIGHPAPAADKVASWTLVVGLIGAPLAWTLQLIAGAAIAGAACIAGDGTKLAVSDLDWAGWAIIVTNLAALVIALVSLAVAFRAFRGTRGERKDSDGGVMDAGEGRTRFLAGWGIWIGVLFAIAIVFNTVSLFWTDLCGT